MANCFIWCVLDIQWVYIYTISNMEDEIKLMYLYFWKFNKLGGFSSILFHYCLLF
jgi:hypothetical protein